MAIISVTTAHRLNLGQQGEHQARTIDFDLSPWKERYGAGQAQLLVQRPGDDVPYPSVLQQEDCLCQWTVTSTDTQNAGFGQVQLLYFVQEKLVKSQRYDTFIQKSLVAEGPVPLPYQAFADKVAQDGVQAKTSASNARQSAQQTGADKRFCAQAVQDCQTAVNTPGRRGDPGLTPQLHIGQVETLPAGSRATAVLHGPAEAPQLDLGLPKGMDGSGTGSTVYKSPQQIPYKDNFTMIFYAAGALNTTITPVGSTASMEVSLREGECWYGVFVNTGISNGSFIRTDGNRHWMSALGDKTGFRFSTPPDICIVIG